MERNRGGRPRHPDILTPAEWRVLDALREGGTNAAIAERLGLSADTVKTHISNMLAKLEVRDRRALAAWRPAEERRGARGWLGLLVRPAVGLAAAGGIVGVIVVFAVLIGGSRDDALSVSVVETDPEVQNCSSGIAVTNPTTNSELVGDCEALLGLRDTIRGSGALNWTAGKAMSEWMGVTVSGTPQRVTGLDLADLGLDGQLSGLVGNLTGLVTLDLSGNRLTGMLPSKLALLTNLTTVSLSGTSFTGCTPPVLRRVMTNDITVTDLDDCVAYTDLRSTTSREELPSGTYSTTGHATSGPALVFDIPEGASFRVRGVQLAERIKPHAGAKSIGNRALVLESADGESAIGLDLQFAGDYGRIVDPDLSEAQQQALNDLMDLIIDSSWIQE